MRKLVIPVAWVSLFCATWAGLATIANALYNASAGPADFSHTWSLFFMTFVLIAIGALALGIQAARR